MDIIHYLSNRANDAFIWSVLDFDDLDLFGPMKRSAVTGIDLEMSEVYGEKVESDINFYLLIVDF